jgi:hypothetical protein
LGFISVVVKRTVLSVVGVVALLVVTVFGVSSCGSADVEDQSYQRNAALAPAKGSDELGDRINRQLGDALGTLDSLTPDEFGDIISRGLIDPDLINRIRFHLDGLSDYKVMPTTTTSRPSELFDFKEMAEWDCDQWDLAAGENGENLDHLLALAEGLGIDRDAILSCFG